MGRSVCKDTGMRYRPGVLVFAAVALLAGACSDSGDTQRVVANKSTTTLSTTTTTLAAGPTTTGAPRPQRVRSLPGAVAAREPKAAKPAAYRGPTPTGRIIIPRIGLDHLTYEGLELSIIDYGPSHWPGTAYPGQVGNTVFPGHRVTKTRPFFDIDLIQIGDEVTFQRDTGRFPYEVTQILIVDDEETWIADPTDTPTFTIFGCHPKHSAKQRYVLKGKLVQSQRTSSGGSSGGGTAPGPGEGQNPGDYPASEPPPTTTTTTPKKPLIPIIGGK